MLRPGRLADNPIVFGSVHSNIGHLDGASGMASLFKIVMQAQHSAIPPVVHFRKLNPLMTGLTAKDVKTVDVRTFGPEGAVRLPNLCSGRGGSRGGEGFTACFPMAQLPMTSRERLAPIGCSSFGFGGAMAHVIVSEAGVAREVKARMPPYAHLRRFEIWTKDAAAERRQAVVDDILTLIESQLRMVLAPWLGPADRARSLARGAPMSLRPEDIPAALVALEERFLLAPLLPELLEKQASLSRLAARLLDLAIRRHTKDIVSEWMGSTGLDLFGQQDAAEEEAPEEASDSEGAGSDVVEAAAVLKAGDPEVDILVKGDPYESADDSGTDAFHHAGAASSAARALYAAVRHACESSGEPFDVDIDTFGVEVGNGAMSSRLEAAAALYKPPHESMQSWDSRVFSFLVLLRRVGRGRDVDSGRE